MPPPIHMPSGIVIDHLFPQTRDSCFTGMKEWNPTFRHRVRPAWLTKLMRSQAKASSGLGIFDPDYQQDKYVGLWDHWGSVKIHPDHPHRALITQPYTYPNHDNYDVMFATARRFADDYGLNVRAMEPGPWGKGTTMFVYTFTNL